MFFDQFLDDRQAQARTFRFRCYVWIEDLTDGACIEAGPVVLDNDLRDLGLLYFRLAYPDFDPTLVVAAFQRLDRIAYQVMQYLDEGGAATSPSLLLLPLRSQAVGCVLLHRLHPDSRRRSSRHVLRPVS